MSRSDLLKSPLRSVSSIFFSIEFFRNWFFFLVYDVFIVASNNLNGHLYSSVNNIIKSVYNSRFVKKQIYAWNNSKYMLRSFLYVVL